MKLLMDRHTFEGRVKQNRTAIDSEFSARDEERRQKEAEEAEEARAVLQRRVNQKRLAEIVREDALVVAGNLLPETETIRTREPVGTVSKLLKLTGLRTPEKSVWLGKTYLTPTHEHIKFNGFRLPEIRHTAIGLMRNGTIVKATSLGHEHSKTEELEWGIRPLTDEDLVPFNLVSVDIETPTTQSLLDTWRKEFLNVMPTELPQATS